jgi:hypothetical protein
MMLPCRNNFAVTEATTGNKTGIGIPCFFIDNVLMVVGSRKQIKREGIIHGCVKMESERYGR